MRRVGVAEIPATRLIVTSCKANLPVELVVPRAFALRNAELLIWAENVVTPNGWNIRGYSSIRVAPPPDPLPQKVRGKAI